MPNPALIVDGQPRQYDFYALADTVSSVVVKTGRGYLHALTVTGGTAGTVVLRDDSSGSGTIIADFASTNAVETYVFDIEFLDGLQVITTAVDTPRLTVAFR